MFIPLYFTISDEIINPKHISLHIYKYKIDTMINANTVIDSYMVKKLTFFYWPGLENQQHMKRNIMKRQHNF